MNKKLKVVLEFDFDQARGVYNLEEAAVAMVQRAIANMPGVGLVSVEEVTEVAA